MAVLIIALPNCAMLFKNVRMDSITVLERKKTKNMQALVDQRISPFSYEINGNKWVILIIHETQDLNDFHNFTICL